MTTEADVAKGAPIAIGVAAAACAVATPIASGICAAGAAIASALTAIGVAIAGASHDTYHPNAATALSWLTLWQFLPGTLWADNDTLQLTGFHREGNLISPRTQTPVWDATLLVRYQLVVSGLANPPAPLYNPRDKRDPKDGHANPFMASKRPDKAYILTDPKVVDRIYRAAKAHGICSAKVPSMIRTAAEAKDALSALRSPHFDWSLFTEWEMLKPCKTALRREVVRARGLAGETGPDRVLDSKFGGSTAPEAHAAADPKMAGLGGSVSDGLGFGLGIVPGLFLGGAAVAAGIAVFNHNKRKAT